MIKKGETHRESLIRRLSEYMEYAEAVSRFSDFGFYEELRDYLQVTENIGETIPLNKRIK